MFVVLYFAPLKQKYIQHRLYTQSSYFNQQKEPLNLGTRKPVVLTQPFWLPQSEFSSRLVKSSSDHVGVSLVMGYPNSWMAWQPHFRKPPCVHPWVTDVQLVVTFLPQVQRLRRGSCRGPHRRPEEDGEATTAYAGAAAVPGTSWYLEDHPTQKGG